VGSALAEACLKTSTKALVCQGNDAHLGCRLLRGIDNPALSSAAGWQSAKQNRLGITAVPHGAASLQATASRAAVCPAGYRHRRTNRAEKHPPGGVIARPFGAFPEPSDFLKVFTMRQTQVAVPEFAPVPAPTFTSAMIRFIASLGMLIGISLLLASL
jgi:hypothetical protein